MTPLVRQLGYASAYFSFSGVLLPQVPSQAWLRSDVLEPQPGVNCWREPYIPGTGCSGQVTSGPFCLPFVVRQCVRATFAQLLGSIAV